MVRTMRLLSALLAVLVTAAAAATAAPVPVKKEGYRTIYGSPTTAKVIVQAFYPLSNTGEDHDWVLKYARNLATAYPGKVCVIAYDYTTPIGGELWMKQDLTCGAFLINGKKEFPVKGRRLSFQKDTILGMWTYAQLKAAVAGELKHPSRKPTDLGPSPAAAKVAARQRTNISILVPCGLAGPFGDIARLFYKSHPEIRVVPSINGVVAMLKQLKDGKVKTDIYLALGSRELRQPALGSKLVDGSLVPCATIPLSVIVPKANPHSIQKLEDLASADVKTVFTYSYNLSGGQGAREALQKANLWERIQPKVFTPQKPDDCKQNIKLGKGDAAIVYRTCLRETYVPDKPPVEEKDLLAAVDLSPDLYEPIIVGAALVKGTKNADAARVFSRFLASPGAKRIWQSWGFGAVK